MSRNFYIAWAAGAGDRPGAVAPAEVWCRSKWHCRPAGPRPAWGDELAKQGRNRQRFDLAPAGGYQQAEVERLLSLGATRLEVGDDGTVVLADPDGNEFCVRRN